MLPNVDVPSSQGSDGAEEFLAVGLVVNTDPFPPVFLVVELHCCPVYGCDERRGCISLEASEFPVLILLEEGDVVVFELDRLLCFIACPLYCVFPDAQEVVEGDKCEVPDRLV